MAGLGGREPDARGRFRRIRHCSQILRRWSNRRRAAIRNRRCGGPARACAGWRRRSRSRVTRSAAPWSPNCSIAGYSLQGNRKTTEGDSHPDRDAQFGYINTQVTAALAEKQPVISVDTKKKELVGDFRNNGREYRPRGNPEEVRVHDFLIKELGRAVPYGIYDLAANSGWLSLVVAPDT